MGGGGSFGDWLSRIPQSTIASIIFGSTCIGAAYCIYATSRSDHVKARPAGSVPPMVNLGNTCYANSLLQALASSPSLIQWLSSLSVEEDNGSMPMKLILAIKQTISQLNDPNTECCSAADVISALLEHRWSIPPNVEQDLYELFDVFVTTWDEELAKLKQENGLIFLGGLETALAQYSDQIKASPAKVNEIQSHGDDDKDLQHASTLEIDLTGVSSAVSAGSVSSDIWSPFENDEPVVSTENYFPESISDINIDGPLNVEYGQELVTEHPRSMKYGSASSSADVGKKIFVPPFRSNGVNHTWMGSADVEPETKLEFTPSADSGSAEKDAEVLENGSSVARDLHLDGVVQNCLYSQRLLSSLLSFDRIKEAVAEERRLRLPCSGLLITQLQCMNLSCQYTKLRQDRFCVLSLTIPKVFPDALLSLDLLLRKYFCSEAIHDASCDKCVEKNSAPGTGVIKKHGLCRLPPLLVLRIERVVYMPSGYCFKKDNRFAFPEILDVERYCFFKKPQVPGFYNGALNGPLHVPLNGTEIIGSLLSATASNTTAVDDALRFKYRLRAVSVHMGEPQSGHFITYRRGTGSVGDKAWYRTSDTQVTRVPFSEVASCEAYMLYYDRIVPSTSVL